MGCPALAREAFTADKLDSQLSLAAKNFLTDETRNRWNEKDKKLQLSQIFEWYGEDFEKSKKFGGLRKFITSVMGLDPEASNLVSSGKAKIEFLDYDWKLNSIPRNN